MFAEATGRFGSCEFASGWRFVDEELISKGIRRVFFTQRDSAAESHCDTGAGVALREDTRKIPYELAFGNRARKIEDRLDLKLQVTAEAWTLETVTGRGTSPTSTASTGFTILLALKREPRNERLRHHECA